ncbi:MAG: GatB/YqeY domain-containing protein, partial [Candidatus Thorarchaeota archaeon]
MTLMEKLKTERIQAMKDKDTVKKSILTLALGEVQSAESRQGSIEDSQIEKIIRKLIAGNEESLSYREDETLVKENEILADFLPKQMT